MRWKLFTAFDVHGEPKGQPRPRAFYNKKTGRAAVYDKGTAEGWKGMIALAAREHLPVAPLDQPLRVAATFYCPRPGRLMRRKDPEGPIPHTAKPDGDNAMKAVLDCLSQVGMWRDDALVCSQIVEKFYAGKNQPTGALIQVFVEGEEEV